MQVKELNPDETSIKWFGVMAVGVTTTSYLVRLIIRSQGFVRVLHSMMESARLYAGLRDNQPVPTSTFLLWAVRAVLVAPFRKLLQTQMGQNLRDTWMFMAAIFVCTFIPLFSVWFNGGLRGGIKVVVSLAICLTAVLVFSAMVCVGVISSYRPWRLKVHARRKADALKRKRKEHWAENTDLL